MDRSETLACRIEGESTQRETEGLTAWSQMLAKLT
jgi:hypothetical protein